LFDGVRCIISQHKFPTFTSRKFCSNFKAIKIAKETFGFDQWHCRICKNFPKIDTVYRPIYTHTGKQNLRKFLARASEWFRKWSGTAEGIEHEPPKAARPKASKGWGLRRGFPLPNKGVRGITPGKMLYIYVQIGASWSANHWWNCIWQIMSLSLMIVPDLFF